MEIKHKTILIGLDAVVAPLVDKFILMGLMPNLKRLIERGSYTHVQSVFPGVTPVNWATVATGAFPGTHGITDFSYLEPRDPLDGGRDGFLSSSYQAETVWQAACRNGLHAATINFPGADSSQHPNHLWVAGRGSPSAKTEYALSNSLCFATEPFLSQMRDAIPIEIKNSVGTMQIKPANETGEGLELNIKIETDSDSMKGVRVFEHSKEIAFLKYGQPSQWIWSDFDINGEKKKCSYKLELTHFNIRLPAVAIYISQITCPADICSQPRMGWQLAEQVGPYLGYCGARGVDRGWCPPERMIDEGRYKGLWMTRVAKRLVIQENYNLVLLKWHLLDHIQHSFWGGMDPHSPFFEPKFERVFTSLIQDSYKVADEMIAELLPLLEKGVNLVLVGDHGHIPHIKAISINNVLLEAGLIKTKPGEQDPPQIDWTQTKVFGGPALGHIWINQQGKRPNGIVAQNEMQSLCDQVIDILNNLRDPQDGSGVIDRIFRKEEAKNIGLWGDRVGDILYWMKPGYSGDFNWSPLTNSRQIIYNLPGQLKSSADFGERKFIADKFQSVHGCGDPSASLGMGSEETILVMAGPGIRKGAILDTIPNLTATAPTLCAASGLPLPAQSEGNVLSEWLA